MHERLQDALGRLSAAVERGDRGGLWQALLALDRSPELVTKIGAALGEADCRRAVQLLAGGEPPIAPRLLARPLAHLGRGHAAVAGLVVQQLRQWLAAAPQDSPQNLYLAIAESGASRLMPALLEGKVFGDVQTRQAIASALGQIGPEHPSFLEARLALADLLLHDRELEVRRSAAGALETHFSDVDQPALLRLSLEEDPALRGTLKRLWERKGAEVVPVPDPEPPRRVLKYYIRQLGPGSTLAFFREFEPIGGHLAVEGSEDREPLEPFFTRQSLTSEGNVVYTLHDGASMVVLKDGSVTFPLGRADWRTRNSVTGVVTVRVPVDQPFEPRGTVTYRPDGMLRIRLEDGGFEEERPDGRRVYITNMGLIQVVSPRSEQGIQTDIRPDLLEKQTNYHYVMLEHNDGSLELFGGEEIAVAPPPGASRATLLPFGALRVEHHDGRVTRELVASEVTHNLIGERTVTFVPRGEVTPVVGVKTFKPRGPVLLSYHDGTEVEVGFDGTRRYKMPDGGWLG